MDRVVDDIIFDFSVKPRLWRASAATRILVASSIYEACKILLDLFQDTPFKGQLRRGDVLQSAGREM